MESTYDKKFNLRLPASVFKKIEKFCATYDRSVNEQMVYMLKTWQEPSIIEDRLARLEAAVLPSDLKKASGQ
ncbi:MAG: Arc family DNA-binding protein [Treponema sp.]|jgi:hypothetical protein|nr:Arc family DNA-binding protein [Treponema sp.]